MANDRIEYARAGNPYDPYGHTDVISTRDYGALQGRHDEYKPNVEAQAAREEYARNAFPENNPRGSWSTGPEFDRALAMKYAQGEREISAKENAAYMAATNQAYENAARHVATEDNRKSQNYGTQMQAQAQTLPTRFAMHKEENANNQAYAENMGLPPPVPKRFSVDQYGGNTGTNSRGSWAANPLGGGGGQYTEGGYAPSFRDTRGEGGAHMPRGQGAKLLPWEVAQQTKQAVAEAARLEARQARVTALGNAVAAASPNMNAEDQKEVAPLLAQMEERGMNAADLVTSPQLAAMASIRGNKYTTLGGYDKPIDLGDGSRLTRDEVPSGFWGNILNPFLNFIARDGNYINWDALHSSDLGANNQLIHQDGSTFVVPQMDPEQYRRLPVRRR